MVNPTLLSSPFNQTTKINPYTPAAANQKIRILWQNFEQSQAKDRVQLDVTVRTALEKADAEWDKTPINICTSRIQTKEKIAKRIKALYFDAARTKWHEMLELFGLKPDYWTDMTEDEKLRITNTLGAEDECDEDVLIPQLPQAPIVQPPQSYFVQPLAPSFPTSSRATNGYSSSYAFVNPSEFNSEEEDFEYDFPFSDPVAMSVEDDDDFMASNPSYPGHGTRASLARSSRASLSASNPSNAPSTRPLVSGFPTPPPAGSATPSFSWDEITSTLRPGSKIPAHLQESLKSEGSLRASMLKKKDNLMADIFSATSSRTTLEQMPPAAVATTTPIAKGLVWGGASSTSWGFGTKDLSSDTIGKQQHPAAAAAAVATPPQTTTVNSNSKKAKGKKSGKGKQRAMIEVVSDEEKDSIDVLWHDSSYFMEPKVILEPKPNVPSNVYNPINDFAVVDDDDINNIDDDDMIFKSSSSSQDDFFDIESSFLSYIMELKVILEPKPSVPLHVYNPIIDFAVDDVDDVIDINNIDDDDMNDIAYLASTFKSSSSSQDEFFDIESRFSSLNPFITGNSSMSSMGGAAAADWGSMGGGGGGGARWTPAVNFNLNDDEDEDSGLPSFPLAPTLATTITTTTSAWHSKNGATPVNGAWSSKKTMATPISQPRQGSNPNPSFAMDEIEPEPAAPPIMSSNAAKGKKALFSTSDKSLIPPPPTVETPTASSKAPVAETPVQPIPTPALAPAPIGTPVTALAALEKMFGKTAKVLVSEFNKVQGEFHYDYSQRVTNNGCYNIMGNTIHNVGNIRPRVIVIYHDGRGSRSMHHGHFASSSVTTVNARDNHATSPYHNPQSQVSIPNNPNQFHIPGQYFYTQSGQRSAVQFPLMNSQLAHMMQEMDSEFSGDNEHDAPEDDISATIRDFNRLAIDGASLSIRSALIHWHTSSSTAARADEGSRHIIIPGDYTEVDNNFYQSNFDSFKDKNNVIEN